MRTYSTQEAAEIVGAPSERWLIEQLRAARFPGRKVGRNWRMTEQDIEHALDICGNETCRAVANAVAPVSRLTPTSRRKLAGRDHLRASHEVRPQE